jgi:adenosylcobinamide-GDP ribazoletransferase
MNALRDYLLAVQFFTRIPLTGAVGRWLDYSPGRLRASAGHFPGVGLLVGALGALVYAGVFLSLAQGPWNALVAAALSTAATVLLTGAFHEDGLADVADALGGAFERERALEIMKDSRIGAFGTLALVLAILSKIALLALLGGLGWQRAGAALVLAHVLSRGWPLLLIRLLPYIGDAGRSKSKPLADRVDAAGAWTALAWIVLTLAVLVAGGHLMPAAVGAAAALSAAAFLCLWRLFRRRLQGFTGDCLGCTQQVTELACYLGLGIAA